MILPVASTLTLNSTVSSSYAGAVTGTGSLVKSGAGTQTFTGNSTHSGATTINGGTLMINGTQSNTGATAVNSGGTLAGTGTMNASAANVNGGTIQGGTGASNTSTLRVGPLSLTGAASKIRVITNGTTANSQIRSAGAVTLGGSTVDVMQTLNVGIYDLVYGTTVTGTSVLGVNNTGKNAYLFTNTALNILQLYVTDVYVTPTGGSTVVSEGGTTDTFDVVLSTAPLGNIVLNVASSDATEGSVSPTTLTFTPANWNVPQTVTLTGLPDGIADGSINYPITVSVNDALSSNEYDGVTDRTVPATTTDFLADVIVSKTTMVVPEPGGTNTFDVRLAVAPLSDVVLTVTSGTPSEGTLSHSMLTFTPTNWNDPQTITVTGVDELIDTPANSTSLVTISVVDASSHNPYDFVPNKTVLVTFADDDVAGFTITPVDAETGESAAVGGAGSFQIVMTSEPTGNVTVPLSSTNTLEGTVRASVGFTPANWNVPQTIVVTGIDDVVIDGAINYTITTGTVTSADPVYGAMAGSTVADVAMVNRDDEIANILVEVVGQTTEAGGTARIRFSLSAQPPAGADVVIPLSIADGTEGSLAVTSITILNANWNNPDANEVVVTGLDEAIDDGDISYVVTTGDPSSATPAFNALTADDVANPTIVNIDNDEAGVVTSRLTLSVVEGGATDTYTVRLASEPIADVTITIAGGSEAGAGPATLTFTPANWNVPQTVTATAVNDRRVDGTTSQAFTHSVESTDPVYDEMAVVNVVATITDNDVAGVTVTESAGSTTVSEWATVTRTTSFSRQSQLKTWWLPSPLEHRPRRWCRPYGSHLSTGTSRKR